MHTTKETVETFKTTLDQKIENGLKLVAYLKGIATTDPWELGLAEGQLLTFEYCRRIIESDEWDVGEMFDATMDRIVAARTT